MALEDTQRMEDSTKPKIGIAISVYNKFEELAVLIDIIRNNWQDKYIISVHSNYQHAEEHLQKLDIDTYSISDDIKFRPDMNIVQTRVSMACRVFNCVKKSCAGANKLDCDYVVHLHSDAWTLKEEGIKDIVRTMEEQNKPVAVRGMGFTRYRPDCPLGHIDDMFLVYKVKFVQEIGLFDVNPLTLLPARLSMHGILSTLLVGKVHLDKIYFYDRYHNNVFWDDQAHKIGDRGMLPTALDKKRGFLHVHRGGLPGEFCQNIQAMYLREYGNTKGKHIEKFLKKYLVDKTTLLREIKAAERKVNRKLKWRGFPVVKWSRFGRDISRKEWYLALSLRKKMKYWTITMLWNIWEPTMKRRLKINISPDYDLWPESLESFYSRELNSADFPDGMLWYKQDSEFAQQQQTTGSQKPAQPQKKSTYARYNVFWWK